MWWHLTQKLSVGLEKKDFVEGKISARNFQKFVKNEVGRVRTILEGIKPLTHANL